MIAVMHGTMLLGKAMLLFVLMNVFSAENNFAQREMDHWFFGYNSGISFNSGAPVFVPGSLRSWEGCSAISDKNGQLLFYTDGITVWNRNHQAMPNGTGLAGDTLSTQSVLITGYPGNDHLFYIFTTDKEKEPDGLQYSMVNMQLNGGLGDVLVTQKNALLLTPVCEKIAAVKHRNANDIWVITHKYGSNEFYVYLVDCAGLNTTPQIIAVGNVINRTGNVIGYLKASPDGSKLAMANFTSVVEVFDFDDATGNISNQQIILSNPNGISGPYGVEFSADSKLLYVSECYNSNGSGNFNLYQYRHSIPTIIDSRIAIDSGYGNAAGALQLGPDDKLYIAYDQTKYIGVIKNPNSYQIGYDHIRQYVPLTGAATSGVGLPNVVAGYKRTLLGNDTTLCEGTEKVLRLNLPNTSYLWQNGTTLDSLVVTTAGSYWVQINHNNCIYRDTINITYTAKSLVNLGNDIAVCAGKFPVVLGQNIPGATYLWQDSAVNSSYTVTREGMYWMQATVNGCAVRDTVLVTEEPVVAFSLGADTTICSNTNATITADASFKSYLWNTGTTANNMLVSNAGNYWCEAVTAAGCRYRDTITISYKPAPVVNLGNDQAICANKFPVVLSQTIPGATCIWQDGSVNTAYIVQRDGLYWMQATVNGCSARDTVLVSTKPVTAFTLGTDTSLCGNNPFTIGTGITFTSYLWSTGNSANSIVVQNSGNYWCEAVNMAGCSYRDTINIVYNPIPPINFGNDIAVCSNQFPIVLGQIFPGATFLWQDGSTNNVYSVAAPGLYWVQATVNGCAGRDTVQVTAKPVTPVDLGADTTICGNANLTISAGAFSSYLWNTGSRSRTITVQNSGDYWCETINNDGCPSRDTIVVSLREGPAFTLGKDTVLCEDAVLLLDVTNAGDDYIWQDGSIQSRYQVNKSGIYHVLVNKSGCSKRDSIAVNYTVKPQPVLGPDKKICPGQELLLTAGTTGSAYVWQDGSTHTTYKATAPGTYKLAVTNSCGTGSDEVVITNGACMLAIPNAFTPDKAQNNKFRVLNGHKLKAFRMQVYNRWAKLLYQTSNAAAGSWNGNYNGTPQPAGIYVYIITYADPFTGQQVFEKGTFLLIR